MTPRGTPQFFLNGEKYLLVRCNIVRYLGFDCSISSQPGLSFHQARFAQTGNHLCGYFVEPENNIYHANVSTTLNFFLSAKVS